MPTGSMSNVLAVRSLVQPGQEVLCEARRTSRGPSSGPTAPTAASPCAPGPTRAATSTSTPSQVAARPRHGSVLRAHRAISVENTHNFAGGTVLPLDLLRDLREFADGGRRRRPPRRRADLERPRRDRHPAGRVRRGRRRAVGVPVEGARRPGRLGAGRARATPSPRRGCGASGWAAACARSASSPRPVCTRSTTTSSGWPTTTPTHGCWPRPAASTRRPWRPTSSSSTGPTPRRTSSARARQGSGSATVGPTTVRMVTHLDVTRADAEAAARILGAL